jgi:hypothetical protein
LNVQVLLWQNICLTWTLDHRCFYSLIGLAKIWEQVIQELFKINTISFIGAPRPDSYYPVTKSITVSLNESASLHFTAIAYPKPKNVVWQKHNGDAWIEINSTNNINLNRSDLNFSLHIKAIVQESYGIYRLIIVNKFGSFEQLFFINGGEL